MEVCRQILQTVPVKNWNDSEKLLTVAFKALL